MPFILNGIWLYGDNTVYLILWCVFLCMFVMFFSCFVISVSVAVDLCVWNKHDDDHDDDDCIYWLQKRKRMAAFREVLEWCQLPYRHLVSGKTVQLTVKPLNEFIIVIIFIHEFHGNTINQSINKFILRHSTEARATVRLCQIKEKCLKTDLKCVNGWNSLIV